MASLADPLDAPEFRLLLATSWLAPEARQAQQQERIQSALAEGVAWDRYLALVDRHRTPALAHAALARAGATLPPEVRSALAQRSDASRRQALGHTLLLLELLQGLAAAAIPAMPLKGLLLSAELYSDHTLRHSKDLDLMVPFERLGEAQGVLTALGWVLDDPDFPLSPLAWQALFRHEWHLGFRHTRTSLHLELHWRNHGEPPAQTQRRWERAHTALWLGVPYTALHPVDTLCFLVAHGASHQWFRAKWLGDLARLHASGGVDWAACQAEAARSGDLIALQLTLQLLQDCYALPWPSALGPGPEKPLHPFLLSFTQKQIADPAEPGTTSLPLAGRLKRGFLLRWFAWQVEPPRPLWQFLAGLFYSREDFRCFPLPNAWFWAYRVLRPAFWLVRVTRGK